MIRKLLLLAVTVVASLTTACKEQADAVKAGSICTVEASEGKFGITKVLVINEEEAHIKVYKNKYDKRPAAVAAKELSMGSITDKGGFGIGHLPLDRQGFDNSKPVVIGFEEVTKDELAGYEMWGNQ